MITIILGTKAQLIKLAPIMASLQAKDIQYNFVFTGQHKETIEQLRGNFGLKKPDIILYEGKDITGLTQVPFWAIRILFKTILKKKRIFGKGCTRDIVLVHGDTFSTVLGALMAKIARKKVAHVEAGLRSFDLGNPFPEEIIRILTFHLSDVYYCPGEWALSNLARYEGEKVNIGGNTLYDALKIALGELDNISVRIPNERYALVSLHRFENIFNKTRLGIILNYLDKISREIKLLFILHPPTKKKLKEFSYLQELMHHKRIEIRPRYDYFKFLKLLVSSEFLITDGGSNQEESTYLGKPTILMRKTTERPEGIGSNVVLSEYKWHKIQDFVRNYEFYAKPPLVFHDTPTTIILEKLTSYF